MKNFFGLSAYTKMSRRASLLVSTMLFALLIGGYFVASYMRHTENPDDKILPSIAQMAAGVERSLAADRNGDRPLVSDTVASLERFFWGIGIAATLGIFVGLTMGVFPPMEALFLRFILYAGKIPPLAILPIIFVFSGLGESTKIILIVVGITPAIALDTYFKTVGLPKEQLVKARTLGASPAEVVYNIVFPQVMPPALNSVRINLINAWLFLIASEAIAASSGLGYRIFLVRRYLAMDTIIPYVLWIALLAFAIDALLSWWIRCRYPWYEK